ncbi:MAG: hypothetical protein ABUK01_05535 [Leptospirales bacterium]
MKNINRKDFLKLTIGLASAGVLGGAGYYFFNNVYNMKEQTGHPEFLSDLTEYFDKTALSQIAKEYFDLFPEEKDLNILKERLLASFDATADDAKEADLRHYLTEKIQIDFSKEQIVYIDSWMLSQTECRLYCALSLLT